MWPALTPWASCVAQTEWRCPCALQTLIKNTSYAQAKQSAVDKDGYFSTGDVASIDPLGFMRITDRVKDVIKSGGEWISSIEVENAALSHEQVLLPGVCLH